MTDAQLNNFYLPAWTRCYRANNWRMKKGRLTAEQPPHDPRLPEMTDVWNFARQIAEADHRGITPRDLRYACHVVKLGKPKDSKRLTTTEVNAVVALFNVLEKPLSIAARSNCDNPEIQQRAGLIATIRELAPDAYVAQISLDQCGTKDWESVETKVLVNFVRTLRDRNPRRTQPTRLEYVKKEPEFVEGPF